MVLLVSEQVHVDVGADGGWPFEVDVVLPETLQGVERPRLIKQQGVIKQNFKLSKNRSWFARSSTSLFKIEPV